jgi:hypothetical protein
MNHPKGVFEGSIFRGETGDEINSGEPWQPKASLRAHAKGVGEAIYHQFLTDCFGRKRLAMT